MSARQTSAVDRAIKRIQKGDTAYCAAKREGLALSTIYRALKRLGKDTTDPDSLLVRVHISPAVAGDYMDRRMFGTTEPRAGWRSVPGDVARAMLADAEILCSRKTVAPASLKRAYRAMRDKLRANVSIQQ